jgi:ankyrin repeat protein
MISWSYFLRSLPTSITEPSNRYLNRSCPILTLLSSFLSSFQFQEGLTPLHIACDNGNLKILSRLLESGADPNILVKISSVSALDPILSPPFIDSSRRSGGVLFASLADDAILISLLCY